jgi:phosphatidylinositol-3-phosphatase
MRRAVLMVGVVALLVGAFTGVAAASVPVGSPCSKGTPRRYSHVVVIAFENHSYHDVLSSAAPRSYFTTLAARCGSAYDFTAAHFPRSLPNYLAATSGGTDGITSDCVPGPSCETANRSIFTELGASQWRTWAESMPTPCYGADTSLYVPRHLPDLYYTRVPHATCVANTRPLTGPLAPISRQFVWVVPNLQHDMHDGTLAQASAWLHAFLAGPQGILRSSTYQAGHMAVFVWFDSAGGNGSQATRIPLLVIAPSVGHRLVRTPLTDAHLLHGWEGLLGLPCLSGACDVSGFDTLFHL